MGFGLAEFLRLFLTTVSLYYPESGNPLLQPPDTLQNEVLQEYDFIVVGAGAAGCVLANRLSENSKWKVLLLEAGGDEDSISDAPYLQFLLPNSEKDWNYTTTKQKKACLYQDGFCHYPRGRVMGGSSTINALMYVRGNKADYDDWAAAGNSGWSYTDVLPYFIKSENNTEPSLQNSPFHGRKGYLNVQYARYMTPLAPKFIQAGIEFGWEEGDFNGENQETIGLQQNTINGPSRESTSKAYLNPIRERNNLSVVKHAVATKVIIDGKYVKGIEYNRNNKKYKVLAKKEVILSAGAIDTPKLLMLSGIGPREELAKHHIPLKADLPVGKHLQDHLLLPIFFELEENVTLTASGWMSVDSIKKYAVERDGPLTTFGAEAATFLNVLNKTQLPNLQIIFTTKDIMTSFSLNKPMIVIVLANVYPHSVGTVKLKSGDWTDPPLIDPNYFGEQIDFEVFEKGFEMILDYMKMPTMSALKPKLSTERYTHCPQSKYINKQEYIRCIINYYSNTIYHPVSTTKMGPPSSKDSVVSPDLRVKGFQNLRVIDASIMPYIVRGNTNAPTIMIAEKGADIIKAHFKVH